MTKRWLTTQTMCAIVLVKCFSSVWYVTPLLVVGAIRLTNGLFQRLRMKNIKRCRHVPFVLSEQMLAQWWHPVASSEVLDILHWAMRLVLYRCIAMAIKTASKVGVFYHHCLFVCHPGGCWGISE